MYTSFYKGSSGCFGNNHFECIFVRGIQIKKDETEQGKSCVGNPGPNGDGILFPLVSDPQTEYVAQIYQFGCRVSQTYQCPTHRNVFNPAVEARLVILQ